MYKILNNSLKLNNHLGTYLTISNKQYMDNFYDLRMNQRKIIEKHCRKINIRIEKNKYNLSTYVIMTFQKCMEKRHVISDLCRIPVYNIEYPHLEIQNYLNISIFKNCLYIKTVHVRILY